MSLKQKIRNLSKKQNDIFAWVFLVIACLIISGAIFVKIRSIPHGLTEGIHPFNSHMTTLEFWIALVGNTSQLSGLYLIQLGFKKDSRKYAVSGMIAFTLGIVILQYLSILKDLAYHYLWG